MDSASKQATTVSALKPVVQYRSAGLPIEVGYHATVIPIDHKSDLVVNGEMAHTSRVVSYDPATGAFETRNTRYILATE